MSREKDVTFNEVYAFLGRGAWLALLAGILAAASAYYYLSRQAPTYEASARVLIGQAPQAGRTAVTDPEVLALAATSQEVMEAAVAILAPDPAARTAGYADALRSRTNARYLVGTTNKVIEISVSGPDPVLAEQEAQAVTIALIRWEADQAGQAAANSAESATQRLAVIQTQIAEIAAVTPGSPDLVGLQALRDQVRSEALQARAVAAAPTPALQFFESTTGSASQVAPRPTFMAALAGILGVLVGYALYLLMESSDGRVRSPEVVRRLTNARVVDVAFQRRDRATPMDRAAATVAATLWSQDTGSDRNRPLTVIVTSVDRSAVPNEFAVSLVQRLAFDGVSTALILPDMKPPVPRPKSPTQSRTPEGPGAYVSVGLDSPKRVTDASLEVIRHSTPADVARLMMPDALRGWLRNEAGQLDVAVIPLPPAGTAIPPPAVAASTAVVLIVPLNAARSDAAAMMSSLEKHGDKLLAVLAVHPSVVGRASKRAAAVATNVTARGVRRAQLG